MKTSFDPSRFQIRGRLGRGGTAEVARVWVPHLRREAALKCPLESESGQSDDFSLLARREQFLIGGLSFPGLIRIIESDPSGDFLLLELSQGPTLDTIGKIQDPGVACAIISALALDLEFLRCLGIVHGDFKPHNVFLPLDWAHLNDGRLRWVKLSDFSLGRLVTEPDDVRAGLGTIGYTAPETLSDGHTTIQSDIFALGVTSYLMLAGEHPFLKQGADPVEVSSRVRLDNPPPLASLRPDVSEQLSDLVAQMMAKRPEQRPKSGWMICQALEKLGCRYPYERGLQPKHAIRDDMSTYDMRQSVIAGSVKAVARFEQLAGDDVVSARLLLTANWRRGLLKYDDGIFRFGNGVYWPLRLRLKVMDAWSRLNLSQRKETVKGAIWCAAGIQQPVSSPKSDSDLSSHLLSGLLSIATFKRLSRRLASECEAESQLDAAGRLYLQAGDFQSAERTVLAAVKQYREQHQFAEAQALLHLAIDYGQMSQPLKALCRLYLEHGEIHQEAGESELAEQAYLLITQCKGAPAPLLARAYNHLGDIYKAKRQFEPGVAALQKALEIFSTLGSDLEVSHVHNNLGNIFSITGDFRSALSHYRRALGVQRRLKLVPEVASTASNMGVIYFWLGRAERGIRVMTLSLKLKRELGDQGEIARTLNNLGCANMSQLRDSLALDQLTESLALNRRIGNQKEILINLENLSQVMLRTGRLAECLSHLKEGVNIANELKDQSHLAAFTTQMGHVLLRMGRLADAQKSAREAATLLEGVSDGEYATSLFRLRFELQYAVGQLSEARATLQEAIRHPLIADMAPMRAQLMIALVRVGISADDEAELLSIASRLKIQRFDLALARERIEAALGAGDLPMAVQAAEELEGFDLSADDIDSARTFLNLAETRLAAGRVEDASRHLDRASSYAQSLGLLPEAIAGRILRAEILFTQRDYESCYQSCRKALDEIKRMLAGMDKSQHISLQNSRRVQKLASMIGRLGTILAKKERAG